MPQPIGSPQSLKARNVKKVHTPVLRSSDQVNRSLTLSPLLKCPDLRHVADAEERAELLFGACFHEIHRRLPALQKAVANCKKVSRAQLIRARQKHAFVWPACMLDGQASRNPAFQLVYID
jgi:hypothetical protein